MKKFSTAMLKGYEKVNGKQAINQGYFRWRGEEIVAACVLGAIKIADHGLNQWEFNNKFEDAWGTPATVLNDAGMPWEHLYGMARAAGL